MKILTIGLLTLFMMNGTIKADDQAVTKNKITLSLDSTSEVSVEGFIAPIENTLSGFHVRWDALANLRVDEPEKQYQTSVFHAFLPDSAVSVGDTWQIEEGSVLKLLRQLHPNPNLDMHINAGDSRGLWACLRAYNDAFAEIVLRVHAEFALKDGWFTPSQFAGSLVIERVQETVTFFQMYVPDGTVNFDVNWKEDPDASYAITDAGLCSQMELRAGTRNFLQDVKFSESISQEAAERALILRFYKSAQINWVPPEQALKMARAAQKPIHVISNDGPLADESC